MPNQKNAPLCFILMPFGVKPDTNGRLIDFNAVYTKIIKPAVIDAGLEPLRADEEKYGGVIHKAMFERLLLCDYAIADLTSANANVFYELGIRHAQRPASTALIFAEGRGALPFDVTNLRGLPYQLTKTGKPKQAKIDRKRLTKMLITQREQPADDSPLYQILNNYPDIQHMKTDTFRDQADYSEQIKEALAEAVEIGSKQEHHKKAVKAINRILKQQKNLAEAEPGILVDILLSYRECSAWPEMVSLVEKLPEELKKTVLVQEQYGLALNRNQQSAKAEKVLKALLDQHGPSSETLGILGRVYKDLWKNAIDARQTRQAKGYLKKSIDTYVAGFNADIRDAYPGINALTLMVQSDKPDPRAEELNTVVAFAVKQKMAKGKPDYWDYATLLELAVLARHKKQADEYLNEALAFKGGYWEGETTANNLNMICSAYQKQNIDTGWLEVIIQALLEEE
ncbi:TRAFs-binding domain-containing protein [Oceanospirillum sediminis]|uniref:DUF4071 domain-containing protein n=1 Tax=Oceanospirillum sediminis TaxID=2760088 RepID=A0A839ILB5_9GAMM|nr:TRAFs-binding domain-containing protein [Oceanospirillum sediminis]MBB1486193.1 DUF4071 domain-containing protein [Oceanospirillum sediminis]